jgi:hypothetical protein
MKRYANDLLKPGSAGVAPDLGDGLLLFAGSSASSSAAKVIGGPRRPYGRLKEQIRKRD